MTFLRSLLYHCWFYLSMGLIGLPALPFALASRDVSMKAIKLWARTQRIALRVLCGIRTEFRGLEHIPPGACIIAMKHQSTYDTIAPFLFIQDPAYILKKELLKLPVFGIYASRVGIPIDRSGGVRTMKNMLKAAKQAGEEGRQVVIFPEGTRQHVDTPTELKPGVVAMYNEMAVPCVPVALNTGLCWQGAGFLRRAGHVIFEVLPPIEPGLERRALTQRLKDTLDPATAKLVAEGRFAQGKSVTPIPLGERLPTK
jgi:1-acyl-sn-glycerol-3-phosphate acyltransferase